GFTVWWDVLHVTKEVLHKNIRKKLFFESLTLHSKLAISMTIYLLVTGCFIIFIFEYNNPLTMKDLSFGDKLLASMFQSVTTRTAGFFTISQEKFTNASAMISMILMFIGGSPAGTAGGMKTTTIAMIILTTISYVKSRNDTEVYKRKIASDNVRMGLVVVTLGIIVLLTSVTLMCAVEDAPFIDIIYELTSALGTVGLSRSLTPTLSTLGKIRVREEMKNGRTGPTTKGGARANRRKSQSKGIEGE
ncbi:potassium transporter KtrB, partial [Lachnotalea glycerini]